MRAYGLTGCVLSRAGAAKPHPHGMHQEQQSKEEQESEEGDERSLVTVQEDHEWAVPRVPGGCLVVDEHGLV